MKDDSRNGAVDVDRLNNAIDSLNEHANTIAKIASLSREVSNANDRLSEGLTVLKQKVEHYDESVRELEIQVKNQHECIDMLKKEIESIDQVQMKQLQVVETKIVDLEATLKTDKTELMEKAYELNALIQRNHKDQMKRTKLILMTLSIALVLVVIVVFR